MSALPKPKGKWRELDSRAAAQLKTRRARLRAKSNAEFYAQIAEWVVKVRAKWGKTQRQFSYIVGVSEITLRRWELGMGHFPTKSNREKLLKLSRMVDIVDWQKD